MNSEGLVNGTGPPELLTTVRRVVRKYGGTSIGKFPLQIAEQSLPNLAEGPIAIICSARSTGLKVEGTTNRLLSAAREVSKPVAAGYDTIIKEIRQDHLAATSVISAKTRAKIDRDIILECEKLRALLASLPKDPFPNAANEDQVMSFGEKLSAQFMTAVLEDSGIPAEYVDLSNIVPPEFHHLGLDENFYQRLAPIIGRRIEACGNNVPVITGFFGPVPGGLLHNCGRGYSDLLAALVAVGTSARELQIWKEIDGLFTADPRKVPTAKLLSSVDSSEMNELTFYGSEVIHHFTIDHCIPHIPIRIKNVKDPSTPGTIITQRKVSTTKDPYPLLRPKRPTAVTTKGSITIVNVHSHRKVGSPEFLSQICLILKKHNMQVDLFELNEMHVSLAVHSQNPFLGGNSSSNSKTSSPHIGAPESEQNTAVEQHHRNLAASIEELSNYGTVEVKHKMAIISLIGRELKRSIGIAGRFLTALGDNNINIEMISQGASEINISCVISGRDERRAVNVVHTALFTFAD